MGLLSLAIWTPVLFGVALLAFGRDTHAKAVRWVALMGALVSLGRDVAAVQRLRAGHGCDAVCRKIHLDRAVPASTTTWVWTESPFG